MCYSYALSLYTSMYIVHELLWCTKLVITTDFNFYALQPDLKNVSTQGDFPVHVSTTQFRTIEGNLRSIATHRDHFVRRLSVR